MTDQTLSGSIPSAAAQPRGLNAALQRQRWQLFGALLCGLLVPFVIRFGFDADLLGRQSGTFGLILAGILISHALVRQFSYYPGETPLSAALPAASMGFGLVVVAIMLSRVDYSRGMLLWAYFATLTWYALIGFYKSRHVRQRLAVVPHEGSGELTRLGWADWQPLSAPPPLETMRHSDGVVADLATALPPDWRSFVLSCGTAGIPVFDSRKAREMMTGQVELSSLANIGFDALLPHRTYQKFKWAFDFVAAIAVLPVVLPVIGAAAAAIRLESPGPALFVQRRVGYRGAVFNCYKLRSMQVNAAASGPNFTTADDPRITRVGRFIRKYRIDELPQIFNILKGEMSWIGPRPEAVPLAETYERNITYYAFRHSVKPGITGWAAIRQGNVAEVDAATAKLRYDFFYIKNISLSLDALIAARTVWTLLTGFGSR